jgi:hypothetical protein
VLLGRASSFVAVAGRSICDSLSISLQGPGHVGTTTLFPSVLATSRIGERISGASTLRELLTVREVARTAAARGDPGEDERLDGIGAQDHLQVGPSERAHPVLPAPVSSAHPLRCPVRFRYFALARRAPLRVSANSCFRAAISFSCTCIAATTMLK